MKRQDIEIGVEYAVTGALAYGREPDRNRPRKVRFTDTRPGPWWRLITTRYAESRSNVTGSGPGWVNDSVEIVHSGSTRGRQVRETPTTLSAAHIDKYGGGDRYAEVGDIVTYLDTGIKNGLPGEVWHGGSWHTTLVVPAEIHRTWAEVEAERAKLDERERELDERSRVGEVQALLAQVGLSPVVRARRSGTGQVALQAVTQDGNLLLQSLTKWASEKGLLS